MAKTIEGESDIPNCIVNYRFVLGIHFVATLPGTCLAHSARRVLLSVLLFIASITTAYLVDREKIGAEFKKGVQHLTFPKVPIAKPKAVEVRGNRFCQRIRSEGGRRASLLLFPAASSSPGPARALLRGPARPCSPLPLEQRAVVSR